MPLWDGCFDTIYIRTMVVLEGSEWPSNVIWVCLVLENGNENKMGIEVNHNIIQ